MLQTSTYVNRPTLEAKVDRLEAEIERLREICYAGGFTETQVRFVVDSGNDVVSALRAIGAIK